MNVLLAVLAVLRPLLAPLGRLLGLGAAFGGGYASARREEALQRAQGEAAAQRERADLERRVRHVEMAAPGDDAAFAAELRRRAAARRERDGAGVSDDG